MTTLPQLWLRLPSKEQAHLAYISAETVSRYQVQAVLRQQRHLQQSRRCSLETQARPSINLDQSSGTGQQLQHKPEDPP